MLLTNVDLRTELKSGSGTTTYIAGATVAKVSL